MATTISGTDQTANQGQDTQSVNLQTSLHRRRVRHGVTGDSESAEWSTASGPNAPMTPSSIARRAPPQSTRAPAPVEPPPVVSAAATRLPPPVESLPQQPAPVEPPPVVGLPQQPAPVEPPPAAGPVVAEPVSSSPLPQPPAPSTPPPSAPAPAPSAPTQNAPTPAAPSAPGDVVGFSLQNTSGAAEGTGYVTFGQVFAKGAVMPGTTLVAKINGQDVAVQMDVKTTNADGSVGHALLTLKAPALAADGSVSGMLAKVAPAPAGAAIQAQDILAKGLDVKVQVTLHNPDGSTTVKTVDAAQLLQQAINAGTVETWMKGAQASEYRVETTIAPNLDVKLDIRMDALGKLHTDVIFARDDAYTTNLSTLNYDVKITQGGQVAFDQANIQQHFYSTWHKEFSSPGAIDPHVVYDMQYLINTGAIPAYDLTTAISPAAIANSLQALSQSNTGPMGSALVNTYMPGAGGRPDIGPESTWTATYLSSQNADAAKVMFANADASGSVPWHLMDNNGDPVRVDLRSNLWLDYRGEQPGPDALPTPYAPWDKTVWTPDAAHQPSLTYVPYLITGSHYYIDELAAQTAFTMAYFPPDLRGFGEGLIPDAIAQPREFAWTLRTLANAAYITPDGDPMKAYFTKLLDNNLTHLIDQYVNGAWGDQQGQLEGWIARATTQFGSITPWQEDYIATALRTAAEKGFSKADTVLGWMDNFLSGRFLNEANGYDPLHGATYISNLYNPATGKLYQTWQEVYQATFGSAPATEMDGWPTWAGGYAANAKAALAGVISSTQSPDAIEAYGWLQSQTTVMVADYATDPTWNIVPKLANGQYLTHDEIHVHTAATAATLTAGNTETMLIGNLGNDTIVGGSGIGMLFGMDGNDSLRSGSAGSYLYGGKGDDRLTAAVAGSASNKTSLTGGTGRDVFAFVAGAHATITDFKSSDDRIELSGIGAGNVKVSNSSGSTFIDLGTSGRITIAGANLSQSALNISYT